jgi:hypothetical protein
MAWNTPRALLPRHVLERVEQSGDSGLRHLGILLSRAAADSNSADLER